MKGLREGFDIVDKDADLIAVDLPNHQSCFSDRNLTLVHEQVIQEIEQGNYIPCATKPTIVSPLGAVDKDNGGVRLIHDCSMPHGMALNDYATLNESYKYETVDTLAQMVRKDMYFAKIDIKSAYRNIGISKQSQQATGLRWVINNKQIYLVDTKLPFGARRSCMIFHRISQAIKRMMQRRGFDLCVYIDDFICMSLVKDVCMQAMNTLISLLRKLGLPVNWQKMVDPTQCITYLGVEVDSTRMELRLPADKLSKIRNHLDKACSKRRLSKRQLQSLIGLLNFGAALVYGGRVFLRRLIDATMKLNKKSDRILIKGELLQDIVWWQHFMAVFNGRSLLLSERSVASIITDACSEGAGACFESDWLYCNWGLDWPEAMNLHINSKETLAVVLAVSRWAPKLANRLVYITCDNTCTVSAINKGTSRSKTVMIGLRLLFWLSAMFNFKLRAVFVPTGLNVTADCISRIHDKRFLNQLNCYVQPTSYRCHMSDLSFFYIVCRGQPQSTPSLPVGLG